MQSRSPQQRGFSLIELMMVVAIVCVLAGMAVIMTFSSTQTAKANNAMDAVVTTLRTGRQLAISKRRNVVVTFTAPNQLQLALQTLPGETPAPPMAPVYLNDNAANGLSFYVFASLPDVPGGVGNDQALKLVDTTTGGTPAAVMFNSSGTFVGSIKLPSYAAVGNNHPVNGTIFIGLAGYTNTARAITILGSTGRVRTYTWSGAWQEQ